MSLWRSTPDLEQLNSFQKNTIGELLDIRFESIDDESISASMVVDQRTHQPYGLLHGGASVVLAETLGSMASFLCIDSSKFYCVGLEVNANHLRGLRSGRVTAVARAIHLGRTTHVWDIRLSGDDGKPSCIARLTMAVVPLGQLPPQ
ncbi:hotdog fold thioesterase [Pseudomonas cavernicola]|uniref:Hotdog fold thioesterase n=1 Tax=Pseudomonas cavernicola TaxID=2320866 RepID=A0A418XAX4_9PSED|nr:hotdog fold thioesterase [Pseudomonas cavernicola]RJG09652.1 hotdog fold thioesterase [Pseudomonas cavernicola]